MYKPASEDQKAHRLDWVAHSLAVDLAENERLAFTYISEHGWITTSNWKPFESLEGASHV